LIYSSTIAFFRINQKFMLKKAIVEEYIKPMLQKRLTTWENLLSSLFLNSNNETQKALFDNLKSFGENVQTEQIKSLLLFEKDQIDLAIQASLENKLISVSREKSKSELHNCSLKYGYTCLDVPGDGNCFFYAVADQLERLGRSGQEIDPDILRMLTAVEIDTHKQRYQAFIPAQTAADVAHDVAKNGEWVGTIAANALARLKRVIIVIVPNDGGTPQVFKPEGATEIIVLGNEVGVHFQSLIALPKLGLAPGKASNTLQMIINNAADLTEEDLVTHAQPKAPANQAPRDAFFANSSRCFHAYTTKSNMKIMFYQDTNTAYAKYDNKSIDLSHIHVNVGNDKDCTVSLDNFPLNKAIVMIKGIEDLSLAFSGEIVITQLAALIPNMKMA